MPPPNYVASWRYDTFRREPKNVPATNAGSAQYQDLTSGAVVWIVTINQRQLLLVGRIDVGEVIDKQEAQRRFPQPWDAPYHIVARQGTEQLLREINITHLAPELRFNGKIDQLPPDFRQSFQRLRELTPETAALFEKLWFELTSEDIAREQRWRLDQQQYFDLLRSLLKCSARIYHRSASLSGLLLKARFSGSEGIFA
jgi:hypothetical protein